MLDDAVLAGLVRSAAGGKMLALHFLDLDQFKAANDRFGHPVGDAVLIEVAQRLRAVLRDSDLVARLGGDEFVVVQPDVIGAGEAELLARRILRTLSAPYRHAGEDVAIGVSIGIAMAPADGDEPQRLMAAADAALYASKRAGRGQLSFYPPARSAGDPVTMAG